MSIRLPHDFSLVSDGDTIRIMVTMASIYDLDAVVEMLAIVRPWLTAHREAVAGDFGLPEPEEPTMMMQIMEVIG